MLNPCELTCRECGILFQFSQEECDFYNDRHLEHYPSSCKSCRIARKDNRAPSQMYDAVCQTCGVAISLPFFPKPDGTYYCKEHFVRK